MKLWFVEPRANIFVSGIKDSVAKKVVAYLHTHCPSESGLMVFCSTSSVPGYRISGYGDTNRVLAQLSGLQLVREKQLKP
jgi:CRISPR-associated protein Cas2|tara:strand:- start:104 stop:343 length:240 start_codon:yes stop_codon:yes gene_type:complete